MPNLFDMTGKTVLVTGGSRGIGRGVVQGFAEAGANVAIVSRKLDACEAAAREIETLGVKALAYGCHVGHWDEIAPMFEAVWTHFGRVDVVVNNAGMSPLYDKLSSVTEQLFDSVIGVNFKGPFRLCALAGERMYEAGGGAIINMSSLSAFGSSPGTAFYGGAKAGLNTIGRACATAFHPRVRVNTVVVGPFNSDVAKHWPDPPASPRDRQTKAGLRVGLPEDMVSTMLYLASDASHYVTGAEIKVDGGGWAVGRSRDADVVS